jgi:hypothetical protein
MGDLLKKADVPEYKDDAWREILQVSGFTPSGVHEEIWRNPHSDLKVKIDIDREKGEPYYQIITEDGTKSARWTDSEALKSIVESRGQQERESPALTPEEEQQYDADFMRDMKIVGRQHTSKNKLGAEAELLPQTKKGWSLIIGDENGKQEFARYYVDSQDEGIEHLKSIANRPLRPDQEQDLREKGVIYFGNRLVSLRNGDYPQRLNVYAGRLPQFSFTVPMEAAGTVAFHLAKAGMKDFEVEHYSDGEISMFTFPSEPEMHVAEEIVKAEYADQIKARKGLWSTWSDENHTPFDKFERGLEPSKYVASAKLKKKKSPLLAGYNFTNKGWLLPDGTFHGWSDINISHNQVAEEMLGLEPDPEGNVAVGDDAAAEEGWVAVSNDGVNVMFTFKRLDRDTINILRSAMLNGAFPARPLITFSNSGFGQPREIHKEFDSPEQAEEWLTNL